MTGSLPESAPLLEVRELSIGFADRRGVFLAADQVSFDVNDNQTVGVLGESGCGKSVTLRAILNLVPHPGEIITGSIGWKGQELLKFSPRDLVKVRGKEISMIFQDPTSSLNPVLTIGDHIIEMLREKLKLTFKAARVRAVELLTQVGIPSPNERLQLYPHQLSGGMRQRVMISMAIAAKPDLLLADEPTTALDVTIQDQILSLLAKLKGETGMSMVLVSHDVGVVAQNCDVIVVMYAGKIMESGPARDVIHGARHPYTRGLLAAVPQLKMGPERQPLTVIPGQPLSLANLTRGCPFQPRCRFVRPACATVPVTLDRKLPSHGSACPIVN